MDLELVRTFIEVADAGSFVRAGLRLNVTQSTVSTRIAALEDELGRALFTRGKAGAFLTGAGIRFQPHARTLLRAWQEARLDSGLPEAFRAILTVGAQFSLWDRLLVDWLSLMAADLPDVALRAEVGQPGELIRRLNDGTLDLGVMYAPQFRAGLAMRPLLTDELVLVATNPRRAGPGTPGYVFVDWGPEFRGSHDEAFPARAAPALAVGLGALALQYLLDRGGSGYFPLRIAAPHIERGALKIVGKAPRFQRPAYAVYREAEVDDVLTAALERMERLATGLGEAGQVTAPPPQAPAPAAPTAEP
jgi:DNA-binding transcriptional LysR family regulator